MHRTFLTAFFGLFSVLALTAQEPNPLEPEILTRGPIHEAYATSPSATPQPGPLAAKAPPELIDELPPDERPEGEVVWIPGYWYWDEERTDYIWISGFWRVPPPGRQWVPGTWRPAGEAFQWTSGFWAGADAQQIEYVPPPPQPLEAAASTPAPGDDYLYAPGCWVYHDARYVWRPGFWYAYRPDWVFIPAHYVWTPCGYVFVDGYWDYPLQRRGVLFAPVYFSSAFYGRPVYRYRPNFVIYDQALYGCLFVRPGFNAYYFGDYFDVRYTNIGYRSWFSVGVGVGSYDPLWGYYRRCYAGNPGWSVGITTLYAGRYSGAVPRPPRTFVQQNTVVNNISKTTVINNTTINNIQNVTLAAPINKVDKTVVNLQPVSAAEQQAAVNAARQFRTAQSERVKLETQALAQNPGTGVGKAKGPAQPIRVNLPTTPIRNTAPPPAPPSPKDQPKAVETPQGKGPPSLPKDSSKAVTKDAPKTGPKGEPKGALPPPLPKDQPKVISPQPKDAPKDQPKSITPPPLPKDQPKVISPQPKDAPKDQPKSITPPPLPKETPKANTPPPLPKEQPKAMIPPPQPKVVNPPPAPKEQPKVSAPPPQPKAATPPPQPKAVNPSPAPPPPKNPPPPPPQPKGPPKNDPPKGKTGNNPPPAPTISGPAPNAPAPRVNPAPPPPPQPKPAPRPTEKGRSGNEKKSDRPN
jgi:hypothetical protein